MPRARDISLVALLFVSMTTALHAQSQFVYTDNDTIVAPNTVSAYSVNNRGQLTQLPGSPSLTGGAGGSTAPTPRKIVTAGRFLYAADAGSSDIAGFRIGGLGALTSVPGSPFPAGTVGQCFGSPGFTCPGMSLAATPSGRFLFAALTGESATFAGSSEIRAFSIGANGTLTELAGSPINAGGQGPTSARTSPNGGFLAVTLTNPPSVAMFAISNTGALSAVTGSPFSLPAQPGGLDINCTGNLLFASFGGGGDVAVFRIGPTGGLQPVAGSPFSPRTAGFAADVLLSANGRNLFESTFFADVVTVYTVANDGSLTELATSPFAAGGTGFGGSLASTATGNLLYVGQPSVAQFSELGVGRDGSLAPIISTDTVAFGISLSLGVATFPTEPCH